MKWQLSLAAFSLGYRAVEFVTWFENLARGCLESSSENDESGYVTDEGMNFNDTRLRRIEVEIHRILHFLMNSDCEDPLAAKAEHAIEILDRTFTLCLRFGQGRLLSSETQPSSQNLSAGWRSSEAKQTSGHGDDSPGKCRRRFVKSFVTSRSALPRWDMRSLMI